MAALESAERAARALLGFPLVFFGAVAFAVLKLPVEATRPLRISLDVYAVLALGTFLFTPFLLAGLYGLADGALADDSSVEDFGRGAGGYFRLLGANLVYATLQHLLLLGFTLAFLAVLAVVLGGAAAAEASTLDPDAVESVVGGLGLVGFAGIVLVGLAYVTTRFVVGFYLQLYKPAAVLGDAGPLSAFGESYRLVRANVESALGFLLLRAFAATVLALPGLVAVVAFVGLGLTTFDGFGDAAGLVMLAVLGLVVFAVGAVELAFLATYRVAFYRALSDLESAGGR